MERSRDGRVFSFRSVIVAGLIIAAVLVLFLWVFRPEPIRNLRLISVTQLRPDQVPNKYGLDDPVHQSSAVYRVRLSGDASWIKRIIGREMNTYMVLRRCDRPEMRIAALGPFVGSLAVDPYDRTGRLALLNPHQPVMYDAYMAVSGSYIWDHDYNKQIGSYDLRQQGLVLCVRIAGGSMIGAYAESNSVKVTLPKIG